MIFLDPTSDIAFKKLFGDQAKKEITISFLNSILERPQGEQIVDVTITDPYNTPDTEWLKLSIVDVRCVDQMGRNYIIELQVERQDDYPERSLYYACLAIARQLKQRGRYIEITPVIFIGVLDFTIFEDSDYVSRHQILNIKTRECVIKHMEFCFIELPKFKKNIEQLDNLADKWIYLLKNASELDRVPKQFKNPSVLEDALEVLNQGNLSPEELDAYDRMVDARRVEASIRDTHARIISEEAHQKGREEGIEEGLEKGIVHGKRLSAISMAKKLLKSGGLTIQQISELTELSVNEIEKLDS